MGNRLGQFTQPSLTVRNIGSKQILVMAVERLAIEILVVTIAEGHGRARQCVIHAPIEARHFPLGGL